MLANHKPSAVYSELGNPRGHCVCGGYSSIGGVSSLLNR